MLANKLIVLLHTIQFSIFPRVFDNQQVEHNRSFQLIYILITGNNFLLIHFITLGEIKNTNDRLAEFELTVAKPLYISVISETCFWSCLCSIFRQFLLQVIHQTVRYHQRAHSRRVYSLRKLRAIINKKNH